MFLFIWLTKYSSAIMGTIAMLFEKLYGRIKTKLVSGKSAKPPHKYLIATSDRDRRPRQELLDQLAHLEAIIDEQETSYRDMSSMNRKLQLGRQEMQTGRNLAIAIFEAVSQPLLVLDGNLRVLTANRAFYQLCEVLPTEMEGQIFAKLPTRQWQIPELHARLNDLVLHNTQVRNFEVVGIFAQGGLKTMFVDARQILNLNDDRALITVDAPLPSDAASPLALQNVGTDPTPTILIQISEVAGAQLQQRDSADDMSVNRIDLFNLL
jgi:PAS domain-containing protein